MKQNPKAPQTPTNEPLLVVTVGLGAIATTYMAGLDRLRKGQTKPIGTLTQTVDQSQPGSATSLAEQLGMTALANIHFGAFDLIETNAYEAAKNARVLNPLDLDQSKEFLSGISAQPGISNRFTPKLNGSNRVEATTAPEQINYVRNALREMKQASDAPKGVLLLCNSTEKLFDYTTLADSPEALATQLSNADTELPPSLIYAYAAMLEGFNVVNATPNNFASAPAINALAKDKNLTLAGCDLKSGQTFMKSILAHAFYQRRLGVSGWFSTNILGNRDGEVLADTDCFRSKEATKLSVIAPELPENAYPDLYSDIEHQVHINYYPPKGDEKEAWDSIQLFGWMGYEMEIKVNFQCRDSILAAPLLLDLTLLIDFANRENEHGIVEWLAPFFKHPLDAAGNRLELTHSEQMLALEKRLQITGLS